MGSIGRPETTGRRRGAAAGLALFAALAAAPGFGQAPSHGNIEEIRFQKRFELPLPAGVKGVPFVELKAEFYDAPAGGRLLWTSAPFRAAVWTVTDAGGDRAMVTQIPARPFGMDVSVPMKNRMWAQFRVSQGAVSARYLVKRGLAPLSVGRRLRRDAYVMYVSLESSWPGAGEARPAPRGDDREITDDMRPLVRIPPPGGGSRPADEPARAGEGPFRGEPGEPLASDGPGASPEPDSPGPGRGTQAKGAARSQQAPGASSGQGASGPAAGAPPVDRVEMANNKYFEALRDYSRGDIKLAMAKLDFAHVLNPEDQEIVAALERMRQETRKLPQGPLGVKAFPSMEDMRRSYDLYFAALRRYSIGDFRGARDRLLEAARVDPTNEGVAVAIGRLQRELASVPDVP